MEAERPRFSCHCNQSIRARITEQPACFRLLQPPYQPPFPTYNDKKSKQVKPKTLPTHGQRRSLG
jgi:hypothetical protein